MAPGPNTEAPEVLNLDPLARLMELQRARDVAEGRALGALAVWEQTRRLGKAKAKGLFWIEATMAELSKAFEAAEAQYRRALAQVSP